MKVGLSGGNSRSFTPVFVVVLAVFVGDFWREMRQTLDNQHFEYSCYFGRYLRARAATVRNMRYF